jgi:hypothetical protein
MPPHTDRYLQILHRQFIWAPWERPNRLQLCRVDVAEISSDGAVVDMEIAVFVRALLTTFVAVILSGCMDSERLGQDFGPRDAERAERIPGK